MEWSKNMTFDALTCQVGGYSYWRLADFRLRLRQREPDAEIGRLGAELTHSSAHPAKPWARTPHGKNSRDSRATSTVPP